MASTVTVTAKTGPALQVTTLALQNVKSIQFDLERSVLYVKGDGPNTKEYDLSTVTTVTFSISGVNYTVTVS